MIKWIAGLGVVIYALYVAALVVLHPQFIYPFYPDPFDHAGFERQERAGATVYVHDAGPEAPVVLYFMGNVGSLTLFAPMLDHHIEQGRSVVALGYPGGGGLEGTPSEALLKSHALAAHGVATEMGGPLVVQGYSLGTGLALHVAANRTVDGVILSAPYARMCRLMAARAYVPACQVPGVQKWNSVKDAPDVQAPVLVVHGTEDALIPLSEGQRLAATLPQELTDFVEIAGAGHTDLLSFPVYLPTLDRFIDGLTP